VAGPRAADQLSELLHWWSARVLAAAIRRRELSAREVVAAHLERIERVNPRVNAIVSLRPEAALAEADAADRRAVAGEPLGPLHGLPIAIKDL
jgi:amidase